MFENSIKSKAEHGFALLPVFEAEQNDVVRNVVESIQRTNEAIREAVDAGISIELIRVSRHHDAGGNWGDQMAPAIRPK